MCEFPGFTLTKDLELFKFLVAVAGAVNELLIQENLDAPEFDWAYWAAPEDAFGHQRLEFVDARGLV